MTATDRMETATARAGFDTALVVGGPLLLAMAELFHPHPGDLLALDLRAWMSVHYAQILLFPLAALSPVLLVRGRAGIAPTVCRVAMFVFAVTYVAFDTAAGVVTGILVGAGRASGAPDAWRAAIETVWLHPIVGGSPALPAPVLALAGCVALAVGTVAAAVVHRSAGHSWPPVVLFAVSGFGIAIFKTHAWPGGPLTFGGMAVTAAWLRSERQLPASQTSRRPGDGKRPSA